jgi:hypothetical protein
MLLGLAQQDQHWCPFIQEEADVALHFSQGQSVAQDG